MTTYRDAASARAERLRGQPSARPGQRRCAEQTGSRPLVRAAARLELRAAADSSALAFEGMASVTNSGYEMWDWAGPYTEVVSVGAFAQTLAQPDLDVPLVLAHDQMRRIARTTNGTLQLDEVTTGDVTGLHVLAPSLDPADPDVAYIAPKLRSGLIDEMSFAFMITAGTWSPDWTEYHIDAVDLHRGDVAIVGFGANPATAGSGLRGLDLDGMSARDLDELHRRVQTARAARTPAPRLTLADIDRYEAVYGS